MTFDGLSERGPGRAPPEPRGGDGLTAADNGGGARIVQGFATALSVVTSALPRPSSPPSGGGGWPSIVDLIVPAIDPMSEEQEDRYHCEAAIWRDRDRIRRELLALFPPVVGWRLVPVEPRPEMVRAMCVAIENTEPVEPDAENDGYDYWNPVAVEAYRAMLAAAPLIADGVG